MNNALTGYPSVDRPWLKYFSEDVLHTNLDVCGMYDFMYANNKDHPDSTALNYFGKKMSYGEFFRNIDTAAKAFSAIGVKAGDIVSLVTLTCVPAVVCMYALNKIGAAPNFLNVLAAEEDFEHFFSEAKSNVVVTLDLFGEKVIRAAKKVGVKNVIAFSLREGMPAVVSLGFAYKTRKMDRSFLSDPVVTMWKSFVAGAKGQPEITYRKNGSELAFFGHTGGTTGVPKGVLLCDHSFNLIANCYKMCMKHERGDVFLSVMIPYVIYSDIINIHMPFCLGLELALIPKFESDKWDEYIKKYNPKHCCVIPAYIQTLLTNETLDKMDLSGLETVGMGGEGLNVPLEESVNSFLKDHNSPARLLKGYGMTEVCATAVTEFDFARKVGSVGIPLPWNRFMIYDSEKQQECTYGVTGEICMQCAANMLGYYENEAEMNTLYRTHPDGSVWLHTGDLGYIDEDGFLFHEGRMKRMIMTVIDGKVYKIPPAKVESLLSTHSGVRDVCVVSASDRNNKVLKAFLILNDNADADTVIPELREMCQKQLAENMVPHFYEVCTEFPRTPAGKVDYKSLES